jgi:nitrous oxidase accessory protein NosD
MKSQNILNLLFRLIGVFLLFGSESVFALAGRTFVSTAGSDVGTCGATAPCRNFGYALTQTASGGEIVVLTSGGYGAVVIAQSVTIIGEGVHPAVSAASGDAITINAPGGTVQIRGLSLIGGGTATNGINVVNGSTVVLSGLTIGGFQNGINAIIPSASASGPFPAVYVRDSLIKANSVAGVSIGGTTGSIGLVSAVIETCQLINNATGIQALDQGHVVVDSSDVLFGAVGISANTANTATAASVDVLLSTLGSSSAAVVSVNTVSGSTAGVFLSTNTIVDANLAASTFLSGTACAITAGDGTCTITTDGGNVITNQGAVNATYSVTPAGAITTSVTLL